MLARQVAIKFPAGERLDVAARQRFVVEARAAARVQHPNVVSVYRVGELEGRPYLVTELVRGVTLESVAAAVALARGAAPRSGPRPGSRGRPSRGGLALRPQAGQRGEGRGRGGEAARLRPRHPPAAGQRRRGEGARARGALRHASLPRARAVARRAALPAKRRVRARGAPSRAVHRRSALRSDSPPGPAERGAGAPGARPLLRGAGGGAPRRGRRPLPSTRAGRALRLGGRAARRPGGGAPRGLRSAPPGREPLPRTQGLSGRPPRALLRPRRRDRCRARPPALRRLRARHRRLRGGQVLALPGRGGAGAPGRCARRRPRLDERHRGARARAARRPVRGALRAHRPAGGRALCRGAGRSARARPRGVPAARPERGAPPLHRSARGADHPGAPGRGRRGRRGAGRARREPSRRAPPLHAARRLPGPLLAAATARRGPLARALLPAAALARSAARGDSRSGERHRHALRERGAGPDPGRRDRRGRGQPAAPAVRPGRAVGAPRHADRRASPRPPSTPPAGWLARSPGTPTPCSPAFLPRAVPAPAACCSGW